MSIFSSCTKNDGSQLKTLKPVDFPIKNRVIEHDVPLTLETCSQPEHDAKCLELLSTPSEDEKNIVSMAVGVSFAEEVIEKNKANIDRKIVELREKVMQVQVDIDDIFSSFDQEDIENELRIALSELVKNWEMYDEYFDRDSKDPAKPHYMSNREWNFLKTDCVEPITAGDISEFSYYFCKEEKFSRTIDALVYKKQEELHIAKELYSGTGNDSLITDISDSIRYLKFLSQNRTSSMYHFIFKVRAQLEALNAGTLVRSNISTTPWIAIQTPPKLWLGLISDRLNSLNRKAGKIEAANSDILEAVTNQSIDIQINEIEQKLRVGENENQKDILQDKIDRNSAKQEQIRKEIARVDEEILANGQRLVRDASLIKPANTEEESDWQRRYLSVNEYKDLAYKDCSLEGSDCKNEALNKTIPLNGISRVRMTSAGEPKIVANGVYSTLNDYLLGADMLAYYFYCMTGDYKHLHKVNAKDWSNYCKANPADFGMDKNIVKPFEFKEYMRGFVEADPNATIMEPCTIDKDTGSVELTSASRISYTLCKNDEKTAEYRRLGSNEERINFVLNFLGDRKRQADEKLRSLREDLKSSWLHRKSDTTTLDGYRISINKGKSLGTSKSKSKSSGFSGGLGGGIAGSGFGPSVGYNQSTSSSSGRSESTSTSSNITVGYYHENAPVVDSVVGKLMGECLNIEGKSHNPKKFLELGQTAFFEVPANCQYLRLFINDMASGIDRDGEKSACVIPKRGNEEPKYPGLYGSHGVLFRLTKDDNLVNNDPKIGCTDLDEAFTLSFSLMSPTEQQLNAGLKLVSDEALKVLFNVESEGKGVISLAANPSAESVALSKFDEKLDSTGTALSPKIRRILQRYVTAWVATEKMKYQKDQLQSDLALLAIDKTGLLATQKRLKEQKKLITEINAYKLDEENIHLMKVAYLKKKSDIYKNALREDIVEISRFLSLYVDSLTYHRPQTSVAALNERLPEIKLIQDLAGKTLIDYYQKQECPQREIIDGLSKASDDLKDELCSLNSAQEKSIVIERISQLLERFSRFESENHAMREYIVKKEVNTCSLDIYEKVNAEPASGGWGAIENIADLERYYIPMKIKINDNNSIFNPDFDDKKACQSISAAAESERCMKNLAQYRKGEIAVPMIEGYYQIDYDINLRDKGCITRAVLDSPQIILSNLELTLGSGAANNSSNLVNDIQLTHSSIVSFTGPDRDGLNRSYITYIDYYSHGDLARTLINRDNWEPAKDQRIKVSYTDQEGPCKNSYDSRECRLSLMNASGNAGSNGEEKYPLGALTHFRPETSISLILPKFTATMATAKPHEKQYLNLLENLQKITLHLYLSIEDL